MEKTVLRGAWLNTASDILAAQESLSVITTEDRTAAELQDVLGRCVDLITAQLARLQ